MAEPSEKNPTLPIPYLVRASARARRISLTVKRDGQCVVTIPKRIPRFLALPQVDRFVRSKADWIARHVKRVKKMQEDAGPVGMTVRRMTQKQKREHFLLHKKEALELINARLAHFNSMYKFTYNDVRVKMLETRWGSCSRKGNLNFSHRLLFLPEEQRDYVVVHELCHLAEFNHGPGFWKLVAKAVPEYMRIRRAMRGRVE